MALVTLASGSAARRVMLLNAGVPIEVAVSDLDETRYKTAARANHDSAEMLALSLATAKALRVSATRSTIVIGADQVLACDDIWYEKPRNLEEARAHLQTLRRRTHRLATGVACAWEGKLVWHHVESPSLTMRDLSDAFIDDYIEAEGAPLLTTVGAYFFEGKGAQLFETVTGSHFTILGLPLLPLLGFLRQSGVLAS